MTKTIYICDRCKKEEITKFGNPDGWKTIDIKLSNINYAASYYLLCKDCSEKIGLIDSKKEDKTSKEKPLAERLLDIIEEIVYSRQPLE